MHQQLEGLQRKPLLPGKGVEVGEHGAQARELHALRHPHILVLSHTYEGISLNGILSILRCPFLNGTSVKGKDTYVNNVFHTGLSGPATLGVFTVLKTLVDLNLIWFESHMRSLISKKKSDYVQLRIYNWTLYAWAGSYADVQPVYCKKLCEYKHRVKRISPLVVYKIRKLKMSCVSIKMRAFPEWPQGGRKQKTPG